MYNLKGSLHVTVCRAEFAKKTYSKHKIGQIYDRGRLTYIYKK